MKENIFEITFFIFIIFEGAFIWRGFKKNPALLNAPANRQGNKAVDFMVVEPWRTKYRWGGVVQVILVILTFLFK